MKAFVRLFYLVVATLCCACVNSQKLVSICPDTISEGPSGGPGTNSTRVDEAVSASNLTPDDARFSFEDRDDTVSHALTDIWHWWNAVPETANDAKDLFELRQKALQVLGQNGEAAARSIIDDFEVAGEDAFELRMSGLMLLGEFESSTGIDYLASLTRLSVPETSRDVEYPETTPAAHAVRIRRLAVEQLGKLAVKGSASARVKLLELVAASDLDIRKRAIRAYYDAASPKDRWRARRTMAKELPLDQRYLLYEIF